MEIEMKTKWFKINKETKIFYSIRYPENIDEAWDKTLEKWELRMEGYMSQDGIETCGLCNYSIRNQYDVQCLSCPIYKITGEVLCSGTPGCGGTPEEEYLFLLLVREATREMS